MDEELKFSIDSKDEDLVATIDAWVRESHPYHNELLKAQKKSLDYYEGNQTSRDEIAGYNSNTVFNRIFEATETLVPIVSGSAHQFIALPGNNNEESLRLSQKLQAVLSRKYHDLDIQGKTEESVRDVVTKRFGVLEWFWDSEIDDVNVRTLDPRIILIPKVRQRPEDLQYVIKLLEFDIEGLKEDFPNVKLEDIGESKEKIETGEHFPHGERQKFQVQEVWTPELVVWKLGEKILDKKANPYWDFEGETVTETDEKGNEQQGELKFFNHLSKPTIPLVFIAPFRTGDAPVSRVSLTEVAIPIQDDINDQKRRINNNLRLMSNGQWLVDKGAIEEEMIDDITNEPGQVIIGDGIASEGRARREPGVPIPNGHFVNLQDSIAALDAVFGVHGAIRGQSDAGTLGGQVLDRQQNLSRIDLITREVNRAIAQLADGITQMMKMYYTERRVFRLLGRNETIEFIEFTRDDIEDDVVVDTRAGQTFPEDPVQRNNRAIQMFQLGLLSPRQAYEMMSLPNPEEMAAELLQWQQGQLVQEAGQQIAVAEAGAQAKAAAQTPPGTTGREVETSNNSTTRAVQEASGTKPPTLPKPSN